MTRPFAVAVAMTAAFFHRAIFGGGVFGARDLQRVYYPLKEYWAERIGSGGFPAWYPYDGLGQSYVGMVISGTFHPFQLLNLALSPERAVTVSVLASFVAAFLGVFLLCRSIGEREALFAAVAYAFTGYLVGITNNWLYLVGAATVPWVLWAFERERPVAAGLLLALLLFSGDSQAFAVAAGLGLVLAGVRRKWGPAVLGVALGACVGAVQIFPALAVAPESMIAGQPMDAVLKWSMHPYRLFELALGPMFARAPETPVTGEVPRLLGVGSDQLWVETLYVGLPVLVLAGLAVFARRRERAMQVGAGVLVLFVLLALGKHAGLYGLLHALPVWENFRYPEKLFPFVALGLAVLAAFGLEAARAELWRTRAALTCGALGVGAIVLGLTVERAGTPALQSGAAAFAFAAALFAREHLRVVLLPAIVFVGLFAANEPLVALTAPEALRTQSPFMAVIAQREGAPRLGGPRVFGAAEVAAVPRRADAPYSDLFAAVTVGAFEAVTPAHFGLEGANAYLPATSKRVRDLADLAPSCVGCAAALGAKYLVYTSVLRPLPEQVAPLELAKDPRFRLHLVGIDAPRAVVVDRRCAAAAGVLAAVRKGDLGVAECDGPSTPGEGTAGSAELVAYLPERVEVKVTAARAARLVLADAFAPGWSATVDGAPAAILRANHAVRAVDVAEGEHRVVFTYETPGLIFGAVLSVVGLIACAMITWRKSL